MPFIGNQPALSYTSFAKQDFTTSATTSYTLDNPVANANELALFINFVRQEPTTAYSASGTTLTLTEATSVGDDMYCVFLGKAVQTVNPPNASVGTSQLVDGAVTSAKLGSNAVDTQVLSLLNASGSAPVFGCRAWVNFDGDESTPSIRASGNVSSITDNGTGDYTVNFTTAMEDANYCTQVSINQSSSAYLRVGSFKTSGTYSTSAVQIICEENNAADVDRNKICVAVFR